MRTLCVELLIAVLMLSATQADGAAADHAGIVKAMAGEVQIVRNGHTIKAAPNMKLAEGDVVQTGPAGKAGLILADDTIISMGFNTRIAIKSFLFQPNDKKLSLITRIFQGTVSFVSGQIARLAPHLVHIETPTATVGLRGTHVLIQVD